MTEFIEKRAGDLKPGDRTQFGTGYENNWRTVSKVDRIGRGIVRVYHRETWDKFYDEWGEHAMVKVVAAGGE